MNGTERYVYDPSNLRVWKQEPSRTLVYFYYNVYFGGKLIWAEASPGFAAGVAAEDRLASVVSRNGAANRYFPHGQEPSATGEDRTKFATYYRDQTTALDYTRNRYYSSTIARFTTPDPYSGSARSGNPQSWNRYSYVLGDPVNFNDPEGLVIHPISCPPGTTMSLRGTCVPYGGGLDLVRFFLPPSGHAPFPHLIAEFIDPLPPRLTARASMLARRARAHNAIYGTGDTVFGSEVLDCMGGRESDWNPQADNGQGFRGMFQMSEDAWADVYRNVANAPTYLPNVFDPERSAAAAAVYLNLRLRWNIGADRYASGGYTDSDLKAAIRAYNGSSIAESYANQIWDCAQKLKAGDLEGALRAIGKP